jgi:CRP/FNR family cyclic AMP-dependent transcriptional regulator
MTTVAFTIFKDAENFKTYAPGDIIFEEGQEGDFMYVVIEGEVEIVYKGEVVNLVEVGEIFGEMALIDNAPRSADARASKESKIVPVDQYNFTHYIQHSPFFAIYVMSVMAERLRKQIN